MIKNSKDLKKEECLKVFLYGIDYAKYRVNKDKGNYFLYKFYNIDNITEEQKLEMDTLSLLEKLGYSMDEIGTYFYKNIIIKIIEELEHSRKIENYDNKNLISELNNNNSKFYLDIAKKDLFIDPELFHKYIKQAILKIDKSKIDNTVLMQIYGNFSEDADYVNQTLILSTYILENYKQECPKVKKMINTKSNN